MFNLAVEQNTNIQLRAVELHDSPLTLELAGKHSLRLLGQFFLCSYNSNMLSVRTIDVLCSSPSPRNSISSLHPLTPDGPNKWVEILSYAVSASGNYVATLSRPNRQLHVDLWGIGMPTAQKLGIRESKIAASMTLVVLSVDHEVSVSCDGSQAAVYCSNAFSLTVGQILYLFDSNISNSSTQSVPTT